MVDLLSHKSNGDLLNLNPNSQNNEQKHCNSEVTCVKTLNSASTLDRDTDGCFLAG